MRLQRMDQAAPAPGCCQRRRASLSVELLLVLPILLAMILGMIEISLLLTARQEVVEASREGARVAALGGTGAEIAQAVRSHLGTGRLVDASIETVIVDASGRPVRPGAPVEVTVRIGADRAVPDLLRFVGFSISNQEIVGRTIMKKE